MLKVGLLHLAPQPGELRHNRSLIERGILVAAVEGCQWAITPELAVCGYTFVPLIGTDWINVQPDEWMREMAGLAAQLGIHLFLSTPERDAGSNLLHNSVFVIGPGGDTLGRHRKINTLRIGSESWSSPGRDLQPIILGDGHVVGAMICADAYSPDVARRLRQQGSNILVSAAAWPPGVHGPNGEWERATADTELPLLVCNRTGSDAVLDFTPGESVVAYGGKRLASVSSPRSTVFIVTLNLHAATAVIEDFYPINL